jgi:hypothetical protein
MCINCWIEDNELQFLYFTQHLRRKRMPLTITEALAEVKTITKRIAKKREFIGGYLVRQDKLKDPLLGDGGSPAAIAREQQAVNDLESRIISIRRAIADANASTEITLHGITRTISDWLTWRREVAPARQLFNQKARGTLATLRIEAQRKGVALRGSEVEVTDPNDLIVNVSEVELSKESEELEHILGDLDGQLSLKNATTMIDV